MRNYMSKDDTLRFKSEMVRAEYTIGSLATALGMNRSTLTSRIKGETDFTKSEMEQIAELFSKSPEEIFFAA